VATGAAATRTAETIAPAASGETEPAKPPTSPTRRLPPDSPPGRAGARRRRVAIAGGFLAVLAAAVAAVVIGGSDGGGESGTSARSPAGDTSRSAPDLEPLSEAELIRRADAVCEVSQRRYREIRDLEGEYAADVLYAKALVQIARPRIRGLRRLSPPPRLAADYEAYVKAQERVLATDERALAAAREGDVAAVDAARERRDGENPLRERLAREVGFTVCSTPQS
jgi:hypothetical protein